MTVRAVRTEGRNPRITIGFKICTVNTSQVCNCFHFHINVQIFYSRKIRCFFVKLKCIRNFIHDRIVIIETLYYHFLQHKGTKRFNFSKCPEVSLGLKRICKYLFYAPNFEEVDGAYWFRVVHPCVRASVRQKPCMLGF